MGDHAIIKYFDRNSDYNSSKFHYKLIMMDRFTIHLTGNLLMTRILDQIDKNILKVIQREGRIAIVDLAERVNLTKSPCLIRLRKLEKDGFIRGYHANINAHMVDQSHLVYVQIKLRNTSRKKLNEFNAAVRAIPEILSCHMMSGGYDYLLKIRSKNVQAYSLFMADVLSDLPGVQQTSTFPVLQEIKESSAIVII